MTEAPLGTLELRMRGWERDEERKRCCKHSYPTCYTDMHAQVYVKTVLYYHECQWKRGHHITKALWCLEDFTLLTSGLVSRWAVGSGTGVLPPLVPTFSTHSAHPVDGRRKRGRDGLFVNNLFHSCAWLLVCSQAERGQQRQDSTSSD